MNGANEFTSMAKKSFDWSRLPAGIYEVKNGEIVLVDDSKIAVDDAAAKVTAALRRFLNDSV
jgi:hypothetical protein